MTLKVHLRKALAPRYEGNYHVVAIKGNQVELAKEGTVLPTKWYHVSHVKPLLQANETINWLPAYDTFGRKGKLAIHPDNIPDTRAHKALTQQAPSRPLVRRGWGSRQAKRGMEKREALEVHRGRNKNNKTSDYHGKKHKNFIKICINKGYSWVRRTVIRCYAFPMERCNQHWNGGRLRSSVKSDKL